MKRRLGAALAAALLLLAAPVGAIIWAGPDGNRHPYVGLVIFGVDGQLSHLCSGTLLSPTVVLTAGHCTTGTDVAIVSFDSVFTASSPLFVGTPVTHPDFGTSFPNTRDVGVVILSSPVTMSTYGVLAPVGTLDRLSTRRGHSNQSFTIVGYGDQAIIPHPEWAPVRHFGTPQLVELDSALAGGFNIHLSGNTGRRAPGGACFGDSGGPALFGSSNVVTGVGSFVLSPTCTGGSLYYRVDTEEVHTFLENFLN